MALSFETAKEQLLARFESLFEQINDIIVAVARLQYLTQKPFHQNNRECFVFFSGEAALFKKKTLTALQKPNGRSAVCLLQ